MKERAVKERIEKELPHDIPSCDISRLIEAIEAKGWRMASLRRVIIYTFEQEVPEAVASKRPDDDFLREPLEPGPKPPADEEPSEADMKFLDDLLQREDVRKRFKHLFAPK
jgi:hypothetical protein